MHLQIIVLLLLTACCPLAFAKATARHWELTDPGYSYTDKSDVSSPSGAALIQQIKKKTSMQGCLVYPGKGFEGIVVKDAPDVRISIDSVELPKDRQILLKYVLKKYSRKPNGFKGHFEASGPWSWNKAHKKKLEFLLKPYKEGDSIEVTGTLCHATVTNVGGMPDDIGYPQMPSSHFFFSVDDVHITRP